MFAILRANLLATGLGILSAILLCICVYQSVRINGFLWWPGLQAKYDSALVKLVEARRELEAISTAKNEQRETTKQNVEKADKGDKQAREIADKIRSAPIPLNCETPGLEILRNEI